VAAHLKDALRAPLARAGDRELAQLSARGDRLAFSELVRRASPVVHDLLRRMGAQPALADDLTQDALVAAYRAIVGYRGEAPFAAWTMRIAARLYIKRYRKDARTELMAEPIDPGADDGLTEAANVARLDLDRALETLSRAERMCVSLCHGAGLTHEEIAGALNIPLGTVKSHVTRGLQKLRRRMAGDGGPQLRRCVGG
jgi:RNA polymerase sigma factor (sigma-70 family)